MKYEKELAAALAAAELASRVIVEHYAALEPMSNAPASITTKTDRESQEIILRYLRAEFPADALRAEEKTAGLDGVPNTGPRLWIVDPIDGTRGFAMKNGEFSIMIAFADEGEAVVGVVAEPAKNRLTFSAKGQGCWRCDGAEPVEVRVSANENAAAMSLVQSHSDPKRGQTRPVRLLMPNRVVETYSAGVKLAMVARGEVDTYACTYDSMNDWDIAAGHALVNEAGGRVSNLTGRPLRYGAGAQSGGLIASNGLLHDAIIRRLTAS